MKTVSFFLFIFSSTLAYANPITTVKSIVSEYYPEASITETDNKTKFTFKTMEFKIHGHQMTGKILETAHNEIGPSHLGFIISITFHENGVNQQAMLPQTLKEPYWNTFLNKINHENGKSQYFGSFSYGSRVQKEFIKKVSEALSPPKA
jgi:hypothetical protein